VPVFVSGVLEGLENAMKGTRNEHGVEELNVLTIWLCFGSSRLQHERRDCLRRTRIDSRDDK